MSPAKNKLLATNAASSSTKSVPQETATATLHGQREAALEPSAHSAVRDKSRNGDRDGGDDGEGDSAGRPHRAKPQFARRIDQVIASPGAEGSDDDLLTTLNLANWLNVSPQWCELGRTKNYGPPFIRLGPQVVRYRRGTVKEWLAERQHSCTTEYTRHNDLNDEVAA